MVTKFLYTGILFLVSIAVFAQTNELIQTKNAELRSLQQSIADLENQLNKKSAEEEQSVAVLNEIEQQSLLINKLINKITSEERKKEKRITAINSDMDEIETVIKKLREEYSKYVVWLYKNGMNSTLKFILDSESFNQALVRYKYLSFITEKNGSRLDELKNNLAYMDQLKISLNEEIKEKIELITQKQIELNRLERRKAEKETLISNLKKDQTAITNEIADKRISETEIKDLITREIEKERERLARLREDKLKNRESPAEIDYSYENFENFSSLQGNLNWPVTKGKIVRKFGENENTKLKTITLNYGIDIETARNAEVYAVAEGVVSAIDWIPGYGSVLILTHKGNFRTVYGHLSGISVDEGDVVFGGDLLGYVNERLEGNIIHFEIWNERNYQNPELWLTNK